MALELSVVRTAKAVGVSRAAYQKWEAADDMQIRRDHVRNLARVLRCSEAHLVDGGPLRPPKEKPLASLDLELLEDVIAGVEMATEGKKETPERKARFILAMYQIRLRAGDSYDQEEMLDHLRSLMAT